VTEFQAALIERVDIAFAFGVAALSIITALVAVIAVRAMWSR
jgi:hypothetical protein